MPGPYFPPPGTWPLSIRCTSGRPGRSSWKRRVSSRSSSLSRQRQAKWRTPWMGTKWGTAAGVMGGFLCWGSPHYKATGEGLRAAHSGASGAHFLPRMGRCTASVASPIRCRRLRAAIGAQRKAQRLPIPSCIGKRFNAAMRFDGQRRPTDDRGRDTRAGKTSSAAQPQEKSSGKKLLIGSCVKQNRNGDATASTVSNPGNPGGVAMAAKGMSAQKWACSGVRGQGGPRGPRGAAEDIGARPLAMGQSAPCTHCLKKPASSWPAASCPRPGARPMSSSIRASGSRSRPPASCCNSSNRPRPNCWPRPGRWPNRSSWTWRGNSPPTTNSALPTWRATISRPRPRWPSRPARCCACTTRRIISAAPARAASERPPPTSCARPWRRSRRKRRCSNRSATGPPPWAGPNARQRSASSCTKFCSNRTRTRPSTRPWSRPVAPRTARRWTCCKRPARSTRPTSSPTHASSSSLSPPPHTFRRCPPYRFQKNRFLLELPPRGAGLAAARAGAARPAALPLSSAQAYSIDDSQTTEIDDALSLQGLGTGSVVLGIHIAAPGLAIAPGSAIDQIGRAGLSRVYMPGHKITMLPDEVVQACTLDAGRASPAVSLYISIDEATLEFKDSETRLDRVHIAANLRHDQLDTVVTEAWLTDPGFQHPQTPQCVSGLRAELSFLYRLAKHLKARRELVRGKPENFNRPDYLFRLLGKRGAEPGGNEQVQISVRQRAAPLDLIVAEAMSVDNGSWGRWMAELGVPGICRSQASMAPGVKVRMGTKALPHAGIGVAAYSWATSPLRRYTDLVNQWQIIACARNGKMAALAAPFKPRDVELLSIITRFDAAYSAYNGHQASMERFWTLKYLAQNGIAEINATVIKEGQGGSPLVRADELPLVFPVLGAQQLPRGARLKVRLGAIDEITLDLHGTVLERLDDPAQRSDDGPLAEAEDAQDETPVAGPIAIAVQVDEPDIDPGPDPGPSASGREDR